MSGGKKRKISPSMAKPIKARHRATPGRQIKYKCTSVLSQRRPLSYFLGDLLLTWVTGQPTSAADGERKAPWAAGPGERQEQGRGTKPLRRRGAKLRGAPVPAAMGQGRGHRLLHASGQLGASRSATGTGLGSHRSPPPGSVSPSPLGSAPGQLPAAAPMPWAVSRALPRGRGGQEGDEGHREPQGRPWGGGGTIAGCQAAGPGVALGDTAGGRGGCGGGRGRGVASPRDRHPAEGGPEAAQPGPVSHPGPGRGRPCLASGHAPATGVNGSQTARPPPARSTGGSANRSARCHPPTNQRARGAGHRSLPGRCPPQWARRAPRSAARPPLTPGSSRAPPRSRSRCSARGRFPPPVAAEASPAAASLLSHCRPPS